MTTPFRRADAVRVKLAHEHNEMLARLRVPTDDETRRRAIVQYQDEGTLEIDHNASVSRALSNDGAYVQAWVWVADPEPTAEATAEPTAEPTAEADA